MSASRGTAFAAVAAIALTGAGCGSKSNENLGRAPLPVETTVYISNDEVSVSPNTFGEKQEKGSTIAQNSSGALPSNDDQIVDFTIANQSDLATKLVINGPVRRISTMIPATGTGNLKAALKTGEYEVSASDAPGSKPALLRIGPFRPSAQNQLLTP